MDAAPEPPCCWQPPLVELLLRDTSDGAEASWAQERNGLVCLSKTLAWVHEVFRDAEDFRQGLDGTLSALKEPWSRASNMVQEAAGRAKELLAIAELDSPEAEQKFHAFLAALVQKLGTLPIGRAVLLPVAWPDASADLSKKNSGFFLPLSGLSRSEVEGRPLHAAIIVVQRRSKTTGSVALVNPTGSGSEYHPRQFNGPPTRPTSCWLPVRIEEVPWSRMCCTVFWLLVFRHSLHKAHKPAPFLIPMGSSRGPVASGGVSHGGSTAAAGGSGGSAGDKHGVGDEDAPTALEIKDDGDPHPALLYEGLLPFLTRERRSAQLAKQLAHPEVASGADPDWSPVPIRDETKVNALLVSMGLALRDPAGSDSGLAQWVVLCLKWEALRRAVEKASTPLRTREACRALARAAAELGCNAGAGPPLPWRPSLLSKIYAWVSDQLSAADLMDAKRQTLPEAPNSWRTPDALTACSHGGFSRLAESVDTAFLAGNPDRPDVILPTPIAQLPAQVKDYHEAAVVVRQSVRLCSLLANQHSVMPNVDYHIVGLVQHLFTNVFPVPRPSNGFWWNQPMQHETQTALTHELGQLARHFVAASLNLPQTVNLHAVRLIVLAALLAVLDVTIRRIPQGIQSELSLVYTGCLRDGVNCSGFGLAVFPLDVETAELTIADHQIALVRIASLDYFEGVAGDGKDTCRRIFGFTQMRFGEGDDELLHRLALLRGFVRGDVKSKDNKAGLRNYFVGQPGDFLSAFPGLMALRETSFLLRWLCTPMSLVMADRRRNDGLPWRAGDAELKWEYSLEDFKFKVTGFQRSLSLEETEQGAAVVKATPRPSAWTSFTEGGLWSLFTSRAVQKRSLSPAALELLAGEGVHTEDHVLHLPRVPTFGDRLSAADSELMLVYLTAPYLRVPLLLQFFNDRSRFSALACTQLQAMLDAALFEPGPFLQPWSTSTRSPSKGDTAVDVVPLPAGQSETMAATPAGRLVNELVHSPEAILPELDGIFRLAMERDTPTYSKDALPVLYAIRLWVRLAAFARQVAACSKSAHNGHSEPPRGFAHAAPKVADLLEARSRAWFIRLRFEAVPTLERWCSRAMASGETDVACTCWLHLALIYRWSHEVSMHSVSTLLCAEVYINTNLKIGTFEGRAEMLGMSEAEIFSLFHGIRGTVYRWLQENNNAQGRDRVLEHVVTVVAASTQNAEDANVLGRRWLELAEMWDGIGRFAPSVPIAADAALAETDFAKWLTGSVDAAPVEINMNIGQLQFRQHTVTPVPRNVTELPEFKEIFADTGSDTSGLMWAMVERTVTRKRFRFAGLRFEFREWERGLSKPNLAFSRNFPSQATAEEQWLVEVLDAEEGVKDIWSGSGKGAWYTPSEEMIGDVARLMTREMNRGKLKEIEVFRNPAMPGSPAVVHVYHTVECGPRFVRVQTFTSDPAWSYAASPQPLQTPATSLLKGATPLLEVVHEDTSGESALVPHRLMAGVLPDSLLDSFEFWRPRNDRLVGKMKPEARRGASIPYALVVHLNGGHGVLVERVTLDASSRTDEAKQIDHLLHGESPGNSSQQLIGSTAPGEVLVDLLRARKDTCIWHAARWALQLDDLSHVLVWMHGEVIDGKLLLEDRPQIDIMEFPRLGLSFSRPADDSRLRCDQHGGLAVVLGPITDANIIRLLRPFPKFVLLEDDTQEKFALVSVADKPSRAADGGVVLVRNDQDWLEKLKTKTAKHYLFAVHPSFEFMSATTPVADLHLMLMRVLHRMYAEACEGVSTILTCDHANDQADEELLWHMVTDTLFGDPGPDAAVLRLKLMLALHRLGRELPANWSPQDDLEAWMSSGNNSFAGRLLTLVEEAALVELCREAASDQLKARGDFYNKLLNIRGLQDDVRPASDTHRATFEISRCLQNVTTASRGDLTLEDAQDLNVLHSMDDTYQTLSHGTITSEDALRPLHLDLVPVSGSHWGGQQKTGVRFIINLLRHGRPRLPEDFFVLFEMACTTRNSWVLPTDDPALACEMLVRLISPEEMSQNAGQAGLLRALLACPTIAKTMPTFSGGYDAFSVSLTVILKEHHKELLSQVSEPVGAVPRPQTPTWKFMLDDEGVWSLVDELPSKALVDVGRRPQSLDQFLDVNGVEEGTGAEGVHALTNQRLLALTHLLKALQDRRLPSPVWDFDSKPRKLAAKAGSMDDDSLQGEEAADDFHSPRSVTSDAEDDEMTDLVGFDDLPPTLQRRLPKVLMSDFRHILSRPMMTRKLRDVVTETTTQATATMTELPVLEILAPDRCPISQTVAGESILRRMRERRGESGEQASTHCFLNMTRASVGEMLADPQKIRDNLLEVSKRLAELHAMLDKDRKTVAQVVKLAVDLANDVIYGSSSPQDVRSRHCAHRLGQLGGSEAFLSFQDITQLLAVNGGAEAVLPHLAQHLDQLSVRNVTSACALAMLLSTRTIICKRCITQLTRMQDLLAKAADGRFKTEMQQTQRGWLSRGLSFITGSAGSEVTLKSGLMTEIADAALQAATEFVTHQHCVDVTSTVATYDPVLLVFQFVSHIMLRKKQVGLVRAMVGAVEHKRPLVHQMLMGQGKTTIITPLVALLSARATRMCVVCTPAALLEFTCSVLRKRLCAALARPVVIFSFSRSDILSDDLRLRLLHFQETRTVLCAGPTALKSMLLRFLLAIHDIDVARSQEQERKEKAKHQSHGQALMNSLSLWKRQHSTDFEERLRNSRHEAEILGAAAKVFLTGVLLLDECDLLMHPLRSELHWPLGDQHTLDYTAGQHGESSGNSFAVAPAVASTTGWQSRSHASQSRNVQASHVANQDAGARWQIALHLLDIVFSCQLPDGPAVRNFSSKPEAAAIIKKFREVVAIGLQEKCLQAAPHLTLLSVDFYHDELRPVLAEWVLVWMRRRHPLGVSDADVVLYLCGETPKEQQRFQDLGEQPMKALNLSRGWLAVLLPHVMSRIHRVHYGLLSETADSWSKESRARRHFAVPFVGKDAPSDTSQFSHPDVVIGLTWVSHRLAGLRPDDFKRALTALMRLQNTEADMAPRLRHARHLYNAWVSAAGAHVRGDMDGNLNVVPTIDQDSLVLQDPSEFRGKGGAGTLVVPPLEWLDINDATQVKAVSEVLRLSPFLMEFYLHEVVFPQLLRHTDAKLSASGHDLGGENLCGSRLGFSGTPNDLLPRSLGACVYEPGDDSQMLHTLTDPSVVQVWRAEEGWSAHSLLKVIAAEQPPLSALIDVGALITGLSNLEVAQMLLDSGLPYEAVVFCDHGGEQQLLLRGRLEPVNLAHCTLPPERRFVFYDQVHTTGIDIKHSPNACAAVTVGKDSTFRDFAQGAYRMRGVGHGQTLRVLLTPEVVARVNAEVPGAADDEGATPQQSPRRKSASGGPANMAAAPAEEASKRPPEVMLDRVCAWLLVKQAGNENKQQSLLRRHAIAHEGRRCAYSLLREKASNRNLSTPSTAPPPEDGQALDLFRERVDYTVETGLPGSRRNVINPINVVVERMLPFLDEEGKDAVRTNLLEVLAENGQESPLNRDVAALLQDKDSVLVEALREQEWELNAEQEQEHEQELFQEQEQEEEQEEEEELEEEREEMAAAAAKTDTWQALPRDEPHDRWRLEVLGEPPTEISGPFYPASKFELPNAGARSELSVPFPSSLWVSRHFHRSGRGRVQRRLRTPSVLLEWVPDEGVLNEEIGGSTGSRATVLPDRARWAMPMLGLETKEMLNMEDARLLLSALNIDASDEEVALLVAHVRRVQAEMEDEASKSSHSPTSPITPRGTSTLQRGRVRSRSSAKGLSAAVEEGLRRANVLQAQPGRYYVLLTLAEAEAVRLALHRRGPDGQLLADKPGCSIALRLLRRETGGLSKLDASRGWRQTPFQWHEHAVAHCVMYLGAESQFSAPELEMLRETMKHNLWNGSQAASPAKLREFWMASYCLRRRPQPPNLTDAPVLYMFKKDEEINRQRHEAIFVETYARLCDAGLGPEKAFQLLDRNQDGEVRPADFAVCQSFGLRLPPRLLPQLFEALDQEGRGFFRRTEWGVAFDARHEMREAAAAEAQVQNGDPIRPPETVPIAALRRIKIEAVSQANFKLVWSSEGMLSRRATSIWEPDLNVSGFMRSSGLRLSIGHYANQGFADCRTGNRNGVKTRLLLQFRDKNIFVRGSTSSQEYLQTVADHYCPYPKKFRLVWSQPRGKPLFVWLPVPPSDAFVALGMVATTSPEMPQVSCVRCVAKSWCQPASKAPVFLWDDSGSGGKPASIWIVNNSQVLWLTPGHMAPQGTCWELANDTISFDYAGQPSVHITHITETLTDPQRQRTSNSLSRRSANAAANRRSTGGAGNSSEAARADRRRSMPAR